MEQHVDPNQLAKEVATYVSLKPSFTLNELIKLFLIEDPELIGVIKGVIYSTPNLVSTKHIICMLCGTEISTNQITGVCPFCNRLTMFMEEEVFQHRKLFKSNNVTCSFCQRTVTKAITGLTGSICPDCAQRLKQTYLDQSQSLDEPKKSQD